MLQYISYGTQKVFPSKIVCIGRNYVEHIYELGNEIPESMVVFNKPNSAVTDEFRYVSPQTRFEGEICFMIEKGGISGIGFGLDLTHADEQNYLKQKGLPWERAKAFDGSAVLSAFIPLEVPLETLEMKLYQNSKLVQYATYDLMIYKPRIMLEEIKRFMTLEDGDIIMSGTPKGVGHFCRGDRFRGEILSEGKVILSSQFDVV